MKFYKITTNTQANTQTIGDAIGAATMSNMAKTLNKRLWAQKYARKATKKVRPAAKPIAAKPIAAKLAETVETIKVSIITSVGTNIGATTRTYATDEGAKVAIAKMASNVAARGGMLLATAEDGTILAAVNLEDESGKGRTPQQVMASALNKAQLAMAKRDARSDAERRSGVPADHEWSVATRVKGELVEVKYYASEELARKAYATATEAAVEKTTVVRLCHYGATVETTKVLKKRAAKTVRIRAFKPMPNGMEEIAGGTTVLPGPVMNWLSEQLGMPAEQVIIKVEAKVNGLDSTDEETAHLAECAARTWEETVRNGLKVGNTTYKPFGHGTNAAKDGYVLMCPDKDGIVEDVRRWALNSPSMKWVRTHAKDAGYAGLQLVYRESWKSMGLPFGVADMAIAESSCIRQLKVEDAIFTYEDGHQERGPMEFDQNSTDGMLIISMSMAWLLSHVSAKGLAKAIAAYNRLVGHSVRLPMSKGYAVVMPIDGAQNYLRNRGIASFNGRDLDDVVFFMDPTVFKGSFGENGSHADLADFIQKADAQVLLDDVGALLWSHGAAPEAKNVSAQLLRCLAPMSREQLRELVKAEIQWIRNASCEKLIGGQVGKLLDLVPELQAIPAMARKLADARARLLKEARRGEFHGIARNYPISCDPFAALSAWAGLDYQDFSAEAVIIRGAQKIPGFQEGMEVAIYRNPLTNLGGVVVRKLFSSYATMFRALQPEREIDGRQYDLLTKVDGTIILSASDWAQTAMRADVDGDHVMLIDDQLWVATIKDVLAKNAHPLLLWNAAKAAKCLYTREGMEAYFASLVRTPNVGVHDDGITKLVDAHEIGTPMTDEELLTIGQLDYQFNNAVDSGKHGSNQTKFVWTKLAESLQKAKLGYSSWANKTEKDPARASRKHEARRETALSIFDCIRMTFERMTVETKVPTYNDDALKAVTQRLQLADAERDAALYGFAAKPNWRFFRYLPNGQLAAVPTTVQSVDGCTLMEANRIAAKESFVANWHDAEGKSHIVDGTVDEDGYPVEIQGKWILNQGTSGFYNVVRARFDDELTELITTEDESLRVKAKLIKANIRVEARASIEEYAFARGFNIRDAFNKVVAVMLKPAAWVPYIPGVSDSNWKPNCFDFNWFETVFAPELQEVIDRLEEERAMEESVEIPSLD